jgi:hypothetical protein
MLYTTIVHPSCTSNVTISPYQRLWVGMYTAKPLTSNQAAQVTHKLALQLLLRPLHA